MCTSQSPLSFQSSELIYWDRSLRPLFLSVIPGNVKQLDKIRVMRAALQVDIDNVVNEFGPQLFEDFQRTRIVTPAAVPAPISPTLTRRRSTYGPAGQGTFLTHPLSQSFSCSSVESKG